MVFRSYTTRISNQVSDVRVLYSITRALNVQYNGAGDNEKKNKRSSLGIFDID